MKHLKIFTSIAFCISCIFFTACSGSKVARTMEKTIRGDWILTAILIEGNNSILNTKLFNEADNNCFTGSSWNFISSNGMGSYTLQPGVGDCTALTRKIRWSIYEPAGEEKRFQFKRLDDKNNPLDDNNGYRLTVVSLTETSMQLKSTITYKNKPVAITYNFLKK